MHILIIGGRSEHYDTALSLGVEVTGFAQFSHVGSRIDDATLKRCKFLEIDIRDIALCTYHAKLLHQTHRFSGVFSFTEDGLETASVISESLGIPGSELIANVITRNKQYTRRALAGTELDNVRWTVSRSIAEATDFCADVGFPAIVKQLNGSGSQNVHLVRNQNELEGVVANLPLSEFLIEAFVEGPEFSVETISLGGKHFVLAITQKTTTENFVEIQHLIPAPLAQAESDAIHDAAMLMLDHIGLNTGITHSEFKLRSGGTDQPTPVLIETQIRPGGGKVWKLVELSTGVNMIQYLIAHTIGLPIGDPAPNMQRTSLAYFPRYDYGIVTRADGIADLQTLPGVEYVDLEIEVGKRTKPYVSSATRNGAIVISGADIDEAIARRDFALSTLNVAVSAD
ncbi:ATP-grasp domain-containing protein [Burkholderia cenocepacia]|uniref:ATP-grasp domain-containing protein n=1 Tax=Burkholderia cenocepacia TaxID=95486 RepID=UPI000D0C6FDF|nr:ATP-grasp domain-containing protein [Burkholderia cenocepacia]SOT40233.1 conserved hypothetical protein [Burkholderia cenocepacia]HDR9880350.1 ATP-grasp domain-containing protein [Burkholderia cenocepacia]HDR9887641.1 ATP-grasp domain-containing protein [Burkholderia cenocepacia]